MKYFLILLLPMMICCGDKEGTCYDHYPKAQCDCIANVKEVDYNKRIDEYIKCNEVK